MNLLFHCTIPFHLPARMAGAGPYLYNEAFTRQAHDHRSSGDPELLDPIMLPGLLPPKNVPSDPLNWHLQQECPDLDAPQNGCLTGSCADLAWF